MKFRVISLMLFAGCFVAGCSTGDTSSSTSSTTTIVDPLSTLLSRIDESVAMYVERAVLQRPQLLNRINKTDLAACTAATTKEIARSVYLNRTAQTPTTNAGITPEALTAMNIGEASAAAQSQIEPALSRCAEGS